MKVVKISFDRGKIVDPSGESRSFDWERSSKLFDRRKELVDPLGEGRSFDKERVSRSRERVTRSFDRRKE